MKHTRKRLGDMLTEAGFITQEQLQIALQEQKQTGRRIGEVLVDLGFVTEDNMLEVLREQLNLPRLNLSRVLIPVEMAAILPEHIARRHQVVPVRLEQGRLVLAMADPLDVVAIDDVRMVTGREVTVVLASRGEIASAIDQLYGGGADYVEQVVQTLREEGNEQEEENLDQSQTMAEETPIVRLVNGIIVDAVKQRASDIHVEPQENNVRIRYRVDGLMRQATVVPKRTQAALISRIKVIGGMDIGERRLPQDGRLQLKVEGREIDIRLSSLPTMFGEKIVMRILDKQTALSQLRLLGFRTDVLERWKRVIHRPYGMIVVAGPTGSGKTSTLYATLNELNSVEKNIITVEDPIEFTLAGVNQVQVNPKAGLTFASSLRSIVRQDPDIIMVGEVRDRDTAVIATQAAMTGHLVLSTLHANDAAGVVSRLIDMGIEPYLVASALTASMAQRLARRLCPECRQPYRLPDEEAMALGIDKVTEVRQFYRPVGCHACDGIGYKGRVAIQELLVVTEEMRVMIVEKKSKEIIQREALQNGMKTLVQDGILKAAEGITSLDEVMRVAAEN